MLGVIVNTIGIILGGMIGTLVKNRLPQKITIAVMEAMGLVNTFIGIQGAMVGKKILVVLISLVLGVIIGTFLDIDKYVENLGEFLKKKFVSNGNKDNARFVEAFVSSSMLFCVGAMAILGSIEAGIKHEYNIFFLKSTLDFISSIVYSTTMGIGVCFSAIIIFVEEGLFTLGASLIKPLTENEALMNEFICCGNIMIMGIGLNLLGVVKIKIINMVPALVLLPIIYHMCVLIGI